MAGKARAQWNAAQVVFMLTFGVLFLTIATVAAGINGWAVVALLAAALFAAGRRRDAHLGPLQHRGLVVTLGVLLLLSFIVPLARPTAESDERQSALVALERSNPLAARAPIAAENDLTLDGLIDKGSKLAAEERARRSAAADASAQHNQAEAARGLKMRNSAAIASAKRELADTIPEQSEERLAIYNRLMALDPGEASYRLEATKIQDHLDDLQNRIDHPESNIEIVHQAWSKAAFGNVFMLDVTLKNTGTRPWKDFVMTCELQAPSGTGLNAASGTIYERLTPGQTRRFRRNNLGFINSAAATASCNVTRATPA